MPRRALDSRIDPTDANTCIDLAVTLEAMTDAVNEILWNCWPADLNVENFPKFSALIPLRDKAERLLKMNEESDGRT